MPGRIWKQREDSLLVRLYGTVPAREIAAKLGRSLGSVHQHATVLGLTVKRDRKVIAKRHAIVRRYHALGWSQSEIAAKAGVSRRTVGYILFAMGLQSNGRNERYRRRVAKKTIAQCRAAGVANLGELRAVRMREFVNRAGWPGVSVRAAQIADALYRLGPMTRRQIAECIGVEWKGSRKTLGNNRCPGHSYLTELERAGYVVRLVKAKKNSGKGRNEDIYFIALEAEPCPTTNP